MAKIVMELTVDQAKAIASWNQVSKAIKTTDKATEKVTKDTKELTKANKALERQAVRTFERSKSAGRRYRDEVRALNQAVKAGVLTDKQRAQALRMVKREMQAAGMAGRNAFGSRALSSIRSIASALGVVGGVAGAVQVLRGEYEKLIEVRQRSKEVSLSAASTELKMMRNLFAQTVLQRDESKAQIKDVARELQIPQSFIEVVAAETLSARAGLTPAEAIAATKPAAQIAPESATIAKALAGGGLDIAKQREDITNESAVGFILAVIARSRIVETEKAAVQIARASAAAVARGETPRLGAALLSAITQGAIDPEGRRSFTGASSVLEAINKPTLLKGDTSEIKAGNLLMQQARDAPGFIATLDFLAQNPEAREVFIDRHPFQKITQASIEGLIDPEGRTRKDFKEFMKVLPKASDPGIFAQQRALLTTTPLQETARIERGVKAALEEQARTPAGQRLARLGIIQEGIGPLLEASGATRISTRLKTLGANLSDDSVDTFINLIAIRAAELERGTTVRTPFGMGIRGTEAMVAPRVPPTASELEQVEIFRSLADLLRTLITQNQNPTLVPPGVKEPIGLDSTDQ